MRIPHVALLVALAVALSISVSAQDASSYMDQAVKAYEAKDYPAFLENMRRAAALRPNHPRIIYNLASAYALNGNSAAAVAGLARLASMGLSMPASQDSDFASLASDPSFAEVVTQFSDNAKPAGHATVAFTLPDKGVVAEGIAFDATHRTWYVGSVHLRKIYAVDAKGRSRIFAENVDALWGAFGLAVDAKRRVLWVTTSWMPQVAGCTPERDGRAGLARFDLATGKLTGAYTLPNTPKGHAIADLAVSTAGDVYVTDSKSAAVYRLQANGTALEPVVEGEPFLSPQGLAFSADGKRLYVADYSRGLFVVDTSTRKAAPVGCGDSVCLQGIDGLAAYKGALVAVQNGIRPHRVVRLTLDTSGTTVTRLDVLAAALPEFDEPTLGTVVDGAFYFVASSGWRTIDDAGKLAPEADLRNPVVMRTGL